MALTTDDFMQFGLKWMGFSEETIGSTNEKTNVA